MVIELTPQIQQLILILWESFDSSSNSLSPKTVIELSTRYSPFSVRANHSSTFSLPLIIVPRGNSLAKHYCNISFPCKLTPVNRKLELTISRQQILNKELGNRGTWEDLLGLDLSPAWTWFWTKNQHWKSQATSQVDKQTDWISDNSGYTST